MKLTLWDHLNNLTINKTELNDKNDVESKSYNIYLINRFVSMCELYIPIVNEVNKYGNIPKKLHHTFLLNILPKRKQYFKYIKKGKELNETELSYIAEYFEIGIREAKMYINLLSEENVKEIIKLYTFGRNEKVKV